MEGVKNMKEKCARKRVKVGKVVDAKKDRKRKKWK